MQTLRRTSHENSTDRELLFRKNLSATRSKIGTAGMWIAAADLWYLLDVMHRRQHTWNSIPYPHNASSTKHSRSA